MLYCFYKSEYKLNIVFFMIFFKIQPTDTIQVPTQIDPWPGTILELLPTFGIFEVRRTSWMILLLAFFSICSIYYKI